MTTATDRAKMIRTELKAQGISSRKVSVRAEYFSMGSALHVTIKDPSISMSVVKAVAEKYESLRRDESTGDILKGGNCYLHLGYTSEANAIRSAQYVEPLRVAMEAAKADPAACIQIGDTHVEVAFSHGDYQLWNGNRAGMHVGTPESAARVVADYVDAREERDAELEEVDAAEKTETVDEPQTERDFDAYPALRLLA